MTTRTAATATYCLLFVLGLLQGLIGSFQYSRSPAPVIAIVLVAAIFATCVLGAWGTRSLGGAASPAAGWIIASFVLSMGNSGGSVIITATQAGEWYLYGGVLACGLGIGAAFVGWSAARTGPR